MDFSIGISVVSACISVIGAIVVFFIKKNINNEFKKEFENYKQKIQFYNSRLSQDFNLWTTERHNMFAKVHHDMKVAQSAVFELQGLKSVPDYKELSVEEMEQVLVSKHWVSKDITEIKKLWDLDKNSAMKKFNDIDRRYLINDAIGKCGEAQNTLIDAELYLSCKLYNDIINVLINIKRLWINYEHEESFSGWPNFNVDELLQEDEKLRHDINNNWEKVVENMRDELSGKYFRNDEQKDNQ